MQSRVAVIVLTHNKYADTAECIDSILATTYPSYDLVLVDNGSTDSSITKLRKRFPTLDILCNADNLGVAGGRNAGWEYCKDRYSPDYSLFLDNDTVVRPDVVGRFVDYMNEHPEVGISGPKTYTASPSNMIMSAGIKTNFYTGLVADVGTGQEDVGQFDTSRDVAACGGFCMFVRRAVFEVCDGFDTVFNPYGWADVDLCLRASKKGFRTSYVASATIRHKGCTVGRGPVPQYEKYKARHFVGLWRRHASPVQQLTGAICVPVRVATKLIRLGARGQVAEVRAQIAAILSALRG